MAPNVISPEAAARALRRGLAADTSRSGKVPPTSKPTELAHPSPGEGGVTLIRASSITPEHVEYLDDGIIPLRVVTIGTGVDGVGKSTIFYDRAARASRGQLQGKFYGKPVDTVIASSEDHPASVIVPRLIAAGADLNRVHIVKVMRDGLSGDISLPDDMDALADKVGEVKARFLLVDPLVAHLPLNIDSHKAQHVRQALAPLARLAEECGLAVVAIVHFNGSTTTDVRSRISGSKALRDASRSVLVFGADPSDESRFVMVQDKNSFGPKPTTGRGYRIETRDVEHRSSTFKTSAVVWLGDVDIDSRALLAGPENHADITEAVAVLDQLLAENGGRVSAADAIAEGEARDIAKHTVRRARQRLGLVVQREGFGTAGKWWWCRPPIDDTPKPDGPSPAPVTYGETVMEQRGLASEPPIDDTAPRVSPMRETEPRTAPFSPVDPADEDLGAYCGRSDFDEWEHAQAVECLAAALDATEVPE